MIFRKATAEEAPILGELRKKQLIDEGHDPTAGNMDEQLLEFFTRRINDGSMIEWVADDKGTIVGTGAIIFYDLPPAFNNVSGIKGYVANVYTDPAYRKRGIATTILEKLKDEARAKGVTMLWLGASDQGRPIYKKVGFQDTNTWMELNHLK